MNLKNHILMSKVLLIGCALFVCTAFGYREPSYCKIIDRLTKRYVKEYAKPRCLRLSGYGGEMMGDIQSVTLRFLSYEALTVDEARILYVEMMEEYLQRINSDEKIRPYLHTFPFEESNIKLNIAFEDSNRKITRDGHVAMIFIGRNHTVYYQAYDPIEKFYDLHEESYEEALRLVKGCSTPEPEQ